MKRTLVIIFLLLSAFLFVSCSKEDTIKANVRDTTSEREMPGQLTGDNSSASQLINCGMVTGIDQLDACRNRTALSVQDCIAITTSEIRYSCYRNMAKIKAQPEICDDISEPIADGDAKTDIKKCLLIVAEVNGSVDVCDDIHYDMLQSACTVTTSDSFADCEQVKNILVKEWCMSQKATTVDECEIISDTFRKDVCISRLATDNAASCEDIPSKDNREMCLMNRAVQSHNVSGCYSLSSTTQKRQCIKEIVKQTKDISMCAKLDKKTIDYCFFGLAVGEGNVNVCKNISNNDMEDECYAEIAIVRNDPRICERIKGDERFKCFSRTIVNVPKDCGLISENLTRQICTAGEIQDLSNCLGWDDEEKDVCLFGIAKKVLHTGICKLIDGSLVADMCYVDIAEATGDKEACKYVDNKGIRDLCMSE